MKKRSAAVCAVVVADVQLTWQLASLQLRHAQGMACARCNLSRSLNGQGSKLQIVNVHTGYKHGSTNELTGSGMHEPRLAGLVYDLGNIISTRDAPEGGRHWCVSMGAHMPTTVGISVQPVGMSMHMCRCIPAHHWSAYCSAAA